MEAPTVEGFITTGEYAAKYSLNRTTVIERLKRGEINGVRNGHYWYAEDAPPPALVVRGSSKRCGMCGVIKRRAEDFSPSRRGTSGVCRECSAHQERLRTGLKNHHKSICYRQELIAQAELQRMPDAAKNHRERCIMAHAHRIEMAGLAGNGKDWIDEQ